MLVFPKPGGKYECERGKRGLVSLSWTVTRAVTTKRREDVRTVNTLHAAVRRAATTTLKLKYQPLLHPLLAPTFIHQHTQ